MRLRQWYEGLVRVSQFGGAPSVALAAGGESGQDRALVRVASACVCAGGYLPRVGAPKIKSRASGGHQQRGACRALGGSVAARDWLALLVSYVPGSRCLLAVLLVVAECSVPLATSAPHGSRPVRWSQADSCRCGGVSFGLTPPARRFCWRSRGLMLWQGGWPDSLVGWSGDAASCFSWSGACCDG